MCKGTYIYMYMYIYPYIYVYTCICIYTYTSTLSRALCLVHFYTKDPKRVKFVVLKNEGGRGGKKKAGQTKGSLLKVTPPW